MPDLTGRGTTAACWCGMELVPREPGRVGCPQHFDNTQTGRASSCDWRTVQGEGYPYLVCADCGATIRPDGTARTEPTCLVGVEGCDCDVMLDGSLATFCECQDCYVCGEINCGGHHA